MHEVRLVVVYAARRFRVARETFSLNQAPVAPARAEPPGRYKIVGSNRPSDERIDNLPP